MIEAEATSTPVAETAAEQEHAAKRIDNVIHVEAVARSLVLTDAGERAVEAVAEPIHGEAQDDEKETDWGDARQPVRQSRTQHRHERQQRQMV